VFSGFICLFDACVLYAAPVRDLVLELAMAKIYRAKWTHRIHDEWMDNLLRKRPDLKPANLQRTRKLINESVEDCLVTGYEALADKLELPDPNDRHVLAAAIKGQVQIIVTYNLKDFPAKTLAEFGMEAQHPDDFFLNQSDLQLSAFLTAVKKIREGLKNPPRNSTQYLEVLRKHSLVKTAAFLDSYLDVI